MAPDDDEALEDDAARTPERPHGEYATYQELSRAERGHTPSPSMPDATIGSLLGGLQWPRAEPVVRAAQSDGAAAAAHDGVHPPYRGQTTPEVLPSVMVSASVDLPAPIAACSSTDDTVVDPVRIAPAPRSWRQLALAAGLVASFGLGAGVDRALVSMRSTTMRAAAPAEVDAASLVTRSPPSASSAGAFPPPLDANGPRPPQAADAPLPPAADPSLPSQAADDPLPPSAADSASLSHAPPGLRRRPVGRPRASGAPHAPSARPPSRPL